MRSGVPEYNKLLFGNPLLAFLLPPMETWNQVLVFTLRILNSRKSLTQDGVDIVDDAEGKYMLSRWTPKDRPNEHSEISTKELVVNLSTNVFAGSDTTAISLRAVIYFLCRHQEAMARAVQEIDNADISGDLSQIISYKEATTPLPFLGAAIKETIRLHPSVGLLLERHVPAGGSFICDKHTPGGTIVGINPWVINRDPHIFPDPDWFIPERWLKASEAQVKEMDTAFSFNFGAGSRTCIGKNLAMMEIHKIIPQLLRRYRLELAQPETDRKICNHFFVQQEGLICPVTRR